MFPSILTSCSWNFLSSIGSGITFLSFAIFSLSRNSSSIFSYSSPFYYRNPSVSSLFRTYKSLVITFFRILFLSLHISFICWNSFLNFSWHQYHLLLKFRIFFKISIFPFRMFQLLSKEIFFLSVVEIFHLSGNNLLAEKDRECCGLYLTVS